MVDLRCLGHGLFVQLGSSFWQICFQVPSTSVKVPLDLLVVKQVGRETDRQNCHVIEKNRPMYALWEAVVQMPFHWQFKIQHLSFAFVSLAQLFLNTVKKKGKSGSFAFQYR